MARHRSDSMLYPIHLVGRVDVGVKGFTELLRHAWWAGRRVIGPGFALPRDPAGGRRSAVARHCAIG